MKLNPYAITALLGLLPILVSPAAQAAPGQLDPTFAPSGGANDQVASVLESPGGKILIGGMFTTVNGTGRVGLAQLNLDGSLDGSFAPVLAGGSGGNGVLEMGLSWGQRIVIGGEFTTVNGESRRRIARLNEDGSLDTAFAPGTGFSDMVTSVSVKPGLYSMVMAGGWFQMFNGQARYYLEQLDIGGNDFSMGGVSPNAPVLCVAWDSSSNDGRLLVGGWFTQISGQSRGGLARTYAGNVDTTFRDPQINGQVRCLAVQTNGWVVFGGSFSSVGGLPRSYLGRVKADGTVDPSFSVTNNSVVNRVLVQPDGKILIAGGFTSVNGQTCNRIARLDSQGRLDPTFNPGGSGANNEIWALGLLSDGRIVIGGEFTQFNGQPRNRVAVLLGEPRVNQWIGGSGTNDWNRDQNWSLGTVPEVNDSVLIDTTNATIVVTNYIAVKSLTLANGTITHLRGAIDGVRMNVAGRLEIQSWGQFNVNGKGYRGGYRDGNTYVQGETRGAGGAATTTGGATLKSGGSYGSPGGGASPNALYGSETAPVDLGSGGSSDGSGGGAWGGNGGGRIDITAGDLLLNGQLLANGSDAVVGGGGSGGSIRLRVSGGNLAGSGILQALGGAGANGGGQGGLGRISVTGYGTNAFVGTLGRAGTLFLQRVGEGGELRLDSTQLSIASGQTYTYGSISTTGTGASQVNNQGTLAFTADAWTVPGNLTLIQDGVIKGAARASNYIGALTVASNAVITHTRGNTSGVALNIAGALIVEAGGKFDVTGKGYRGGYRDGNTYVQGETRGAGGAATTTGGASLRSGGSYGSLGVGASPNALYGSETAPVDLGSGGAGDGSGAGAWGGNGGGRIDITAGDLLVDGQLLANGGAAVFGGGGSGGTIRLQVNGGNLAGSGVIEAAGGAGANGGGKGGGGRIAISGFAARTFAGTLIQEGTVSLVPAGPLDSDGDGIPDAYESAHNLNQNDPNDAAADADQDGLSNLQEFLAGTDPRDSQSVFKAPQPQVRGNSLDFTFNTVSAKRYRLEYRDTLSGNTWFVLQDNIVGTGGTVSVSDANPTNRLSRYYRLVLIP